MAQNLGIQAANLTAAARSRGRSFQGQGVVVQPVVSPDSGAAARDRQLAHDEMIARQLQEELYNEIPGDWSVEEVIASFLFFFHCPLSCSQDKRRDS
jgi:predicted transcriptional regulator